MLNMIQLSNVAEGIHPSLTRTLFNMAKEYDDVIDFTLGDPDVQTHQAIKDAGCAAIQAGKTRYSQNAGLPELRDTISKYYLRKENLEYNSENEIIVTVGAMEGLYLVLLSLINPGDEVIIPAPYYINYVQMTRMCGGVPIIVDSRQDLSVDVEAIEKAVTDRTKAIIINTPANPSGKIIPQESIGILAEIAINNNLVVISDEVYKCLIYNGANFKSIAALEGMRNRTILVNSLSKEFCMTGWRIGYVLGPEDIIAAMTRLQENVAACAPLPSQWAAVEALSGKEDYSAEMVDVFHRRRDLLVDGINGIAGLTCIPPEATFYLLVDISATGMSSEEFAKDMLKKVHVAVVPGITYGKCCDKYVRIAFTVGEDKIKEGVRRIGNYIKSLAL